MLYLAILLMFVFFAGVAMTINEGLWNNTILLFLIMICGVLSFAIGVPTGSSLVEQLEAREEVVWDYVMSDVWFVFVVSMSIMRALLNKASGVRVKFFGPLEMVAGPLMGILAAVMFTSFTAYTLVQFPIQSGVWSRADEAGWVITFFNFICAPFYNVMNAFAGSEGITSPVFVM